MRCGPEKRGAINNREAKKLCGAPKSAGPLALAQSAPPLNPALVRTEIANAHENFFKANLNRSAIDLSQKLYLNVNASPNPNGDRSETIVNTLSKQTWIQDGWSISSNNFRIISDSTVHAVLCNIQDQAALYSKRELKEDPV